MNNLQVSGTPFKVLENIRWDDLTGAAHFAVSATGTLAYAFGGAYAPDNALLLSDFHGNVHPILQDRWVFDAAYSLDGRLALHIAATNDDLWILDPERLQLSRFTSSFGDEEAPVWTPDGRHIIYTWRKKNLFRQAVDGSGKPEPLISSEYAVFPYSVSPDGSVLAYCELNPISRSDIWFLPLNGEGKPQRFLATPFSEGSPKFSPNGRWIAYVSDESGRNEIYLQRAQTTGRKILVSTTGGNSPVWSHAGNRLFFLNGNKFMVAKVDPESGAPGSAELLFEIQKPSQVISYDVAPGDKSVAIVIQSVQPPASELRIVQNWFEELKRLVPTGKK